LKEEGRAKGQSNGLGREGKSIGFNLQAEGEAFSGSKPDTKD
jgi:hypothetical protein